MKEDPYLYTMSLDESEFISAMLKNKDLENEVDRNIKELLSGMKSLITLKVLEFMYHNSNN